MMAARVAAAVQRDVPGVRAEIVPGGFLELSVSVDGRKVVETRRVFSPLPGRLIASLKEALGPAAPATHRADPARPRHD
jgi:hypothetical protein